MPLTEVAVAANSGSRVSCQLRATRFISFVAPLSISSVSAAVIDRHASSRRGALGQPRIGVMNETEKARRAAKHPDRPGESCRAEAGRWRPVVDRAAEACQACGLCVVACPEKAISLVLA